MAERLSPRFRVVRGTVSSKQAPNSMKDPAGSVRKVRSVLVFECACFPYSEMGSSKHEN